MIRKLGNFLKNKSINNSLAFISIVLALILAFYPSILSLEYCQIDAECYEELKNNMDDEARKFVESCIGKRYKNPKNFIKSIPVTLSETDRNYIIDNFKYIMDYGDFHTKIIIFLFVLFAIGVIIREWSSSRKYSIVHSIYYLHQAIHQIRDNWDKIFVENGDKVKINKDEARKHFNSSLDEVEKYFSTITGAPCGAVVKVLLDPKKVEEVEDSPDTADIRVGTFARGSKTRNKSADITNDFIHKNTDFVAIAQEQEKYYYKRDVDEKGVYHNSRVLGGKSPLKTSTQLGYKSHITFGIRGKNTNGDTTLYGFLRIICNHRNIFKVRYDTEPGFLLADFYSLFIKIYLRVNEINEKVGEKNESSSDSTRTE